MKGMTTGPKGGTAKGSKPFSTSMRAETSNMAKGKSSKNMGVKGKSGK